MAFRKLNDMFEGDSLTENKSINEWNDTNENNYIINESDVGHSTKKFSQSSVGSSVKASQNRKKLEDIGSRVINESPLPYLNIQDSLDQIDYHHEINDSATNYNSNNSKSLQAKTNKNLSLDSDTKESVDIEEDSFQYKSRSSNKKKPNTKIVDLSDSDIVPTKSTNQRKAINYTDDEEDEGEDEDDDEDNDEDESESEDQNDESEQDSFQYKSKPSDKKKPNTKMTDFSDSDIVHVKHNKQRNAINYTDDEEEIEVGEKDQCERRDANESVDAVETKIEESLTESSELVKIENLKEKYQNKSNDLGNFQQIRDRSQYNETDEDEDHSESKKDDSNQLYEASNEPQESRYDDEKLVEQISVNVEKEANRFDISNDDIIELSPNQTPTKLSSTRINDETINVQASRLNQIQSFRIDDKRQIASWSPNFEKAKSKVQQSLKEKQEVQRKIQVIDLEQEEKDKQTFLNQLKDYKEHKDYKLSAPAIRTSSIQVTNRNYSFEDQLKVLSEKMLEVLEHKPSADLTYDDMKCPTGLKVNLLAHQRYSIQWLKWREKNYPNGSILADDMGLGKTLTILSYLKLMKDERENAVEKMKDEEEANDDEDDDDYDKKKKQLKNKYISNKYRVKRLKTLIIVPASLMLQWEGEIKSKFQSDSFKYHKYHEANRKKHAYNLEDNDIVFTTYEIISREIKLADKDGEERPSDSPLARIKWKRIILDEAHRIKNHSTKANKSICLLRAKYRIAITGTPIHNSIMDLYSLVKFLHFSPLDDITLWKYIFASETFSSTKSSQSANAIERQKRSDSWLAFLADYLILRRCKSDTLKSTGKKIVDLPTKDVEIVRFRLNMSEDAIYQKIFKESKEKVKTFLLNQQQRLMGRSAASTNAVSEIFVYLLRLRQACCHMSLLGECLDKDELQNIKLEAQGIDGLMQNMSLNDTDMSGQNKLTESLDKSSDLTLCLDKTYVSSKLDKLLQMVETVLEENPDDKLIIVSQWTSMLSIIAKCLRDRDVDYCEIKGEILLFRRNEIVEEFNDKNNKQKRVMLLSLTAGGVGLNLVGANRMFLLDIHWNPALEQQCSDRIYRVGQTKNVKIYRFLCENTIEERIEQIQHLKIGLAQKVCGDVPIGGGARTNSAKLTVKDFKLLFQDFDNTTNSTQL